MQDKKILFSDLDGTLLKNDKSISKRNLEAVKSMLDAGHYFVITSGRPVAAAKHIAKEIGVMIPGCYMITYNGAVIYNCENGTNLMEKTVSLEHVTYLFEEAKKYGLHVQTYSDDHVLTMEETEEMKFYSKSTTMKYKVTDDVIKTLQREPNKVLLSSLTEHAKLLQFQKDHLDWQEGKCNSFFSCDEYLEYCPYQTSKGSAIEYLVNYLNIPMKHTFAVGDELNDIPMLSVVEHGIAMKNAKEKVKEAADYVLEFDNEQDGVAELINKWIL